MPRLVERIAAAKKAFINPMLIEETSPEETANELKQIVNDVSRRERQSVADRLQRFVNELSK